jgi:squalene-associated FAD-dependent desaturase
LAAAVRATQAGHQVTLMEAARHLGGRARTLPTARSDSPHTPLDNGQHILIGAYRDTLALMRTVGVDPDATLLRLPLSLQFPNGDGLCLPNWPLPFDVMAGVLRAGGWSLADKWSLLRATSRWQLAGFCCAPQQSVSDLCAGLSATVMQTLIEPLCVSALNTPPERASGQVFLRVLQDSLLGGNGSSNLLLPRTDLSSLLPTAAAGWLARHGATLRLGQRVTQVQHQSHSEGPWLLDGQAFDAVVWATSSSVASQVLAKTRGTHANALQVWAAQAAALQFEAIATVYLQTDSARLSQPMLALSSSPDCPAQFVFDRGQLGGPAGLLALVVSASGSDRATLQEQVLLQARTHLASALRGQTLTPLRTVVEKRATFACTPGLLRPGRAIAPGLLACGDYVDGPYPATLEGAVRSGLAAAQALATVA